MNYAYCVIFFGAIIDTLKKIFYKISSTWINAIDHLSYQCVTHAIGRSSYKCIIEYGWHFVYHI